VLVGHILTHAAHRWPNHPALVDEDGRSFTYAEWNARVNRLANALALLGIGRGDRVAFYLRNVEALASAHLATQKLGAVSVPLNFRLREGEIPIIVEDSETRILLFERQPRERSVVQERNPARLNAAEVRIALGTDSNTGWGAHAEMADMVAAGMTPSQVIVSATRNSAEILRLADHGTVAAGKSADFIVLDANPLDNITNTRRIARVYLRGIEVDRAALRARWSGNKSQ
jgi:imidazolonepropionase-like amidohydrolase